MMVVSSEDIDVPFNSGLRADTMMLVERRRTAIVSKTKRFFCMRLFLSEMILLSIYKYFFLKYIKKRKRGIRRDIHQS
jgi:hypothetical protein